MSEDFLHFIWKARLFPRRLQTVDGQPVEVLDTGRYNTDAGPDFFNARIRIGDTVWAGNVEMHVRASDWDAHGHQHDTAYRTTILHVVFDADRPAATGPIPVVALQGSVSHDMLTRYRYLNKTKAAIPCSPLLSSVRRIVADKWLERVLVERLEARTAVAERLVSLNQSGWEETFYQLLARNFGFRLNADPFEQLARSLPLRTIQKQKDNLTQVEAMLFGTAGLLEGLFRDAYPVALQDEYRFLRNKYGLDPMPAHRWKFARSRPTNFPTVRIAQFAMLLHRREHLLGTVLDTETTESLRTLFGIAPSEYWIGHYRFDTASRKIEKNLGRSSIDNILINTVAPFLFHYGRAKHKPALCDRALSLLTALPPEDNTVTRQWKRNGLTAGNAFESQALLELKKNYCNGRQCLRCGIGTDILRGGPAGVEEDAASHLSEQTLTYD